MIEIRAESIGFLSTQHVDDGCRVKRDERVAEIELMKTFFSVTAPADGVIRFRVQLGEQVSVGDVIATIE